MQARNQQQLNGIRKFLKIQESEVNFAATNYSEFIKYDNLNYITEPTITMDLSELDLQNIINGNVDLIKLCRLEKTYCHTQVIFKQCMDWGCLRALIMNLIKLKGTAKLTAQGERIYFKESKYILFEILENQTWMGRTSSCRPSKPDLAIWPAQPAGACTALPCPLC